MEKQNIGFEQKEKLKFQDLAIYTTTFYGKDPVSKVREKLAIQLLENAQKLGIHCVVVDGGSNEDFLGTVKKMSNVELHIDSSLGMGDSRRQALSKAMEISAATFFLWVEPEKDNLINEEDLEAMISGLRDDSADVVVPKRRSKETMPKFQAWIEDRANQRAMKTAGINQEEARGVWDLWFGPKMFNRDGAKYFLEYKGKLDKWDAIIKPVINAFKDGKRISDVPVGYKYDLSQKESEENDYEMKKKRLIQYIKILAELGDDYWKDKI